MNMLALIGAHWQIAVAALAAVAFCILLPGPALAVGRWLFGTDRGRYVLLLAAITGAWLWYRGSLIASVEAECKAKSTQAAHAAQIAVAQAQTRGAIAALDSYMAGAAAQAAIGTQLEKDHAKALRDRDRTIACLRDGSCRLLEHWACAVPAGDAGGAAAGGSGRDALAELRAAGAADLVRIAADADAQLRACQATVTDYQRRGVLRPAPTPP